MRKILLLFLLSGIITRPVLVAQTPTLTIKGSDKEKNVYLQKLDINVDVVGNIAMTTMTMTFKNSTYQILEGELLFPLPEGVTVSRYALDINGKMRNAVPVAKAKATQVFEEIERRNVDPGILEKVEGNNFRTRIYPFIPNASRTIMISYEQELPVEEKELHYRLPLDYKQPIESFSLKITVLQQENRPRVKESPDQNITFDRQGTQYVASFSGQNYQPSNRLAFVIPLSDSQPQIVMRPAEGSYYFYINQFIKGESRPKNWSDRIGILWDVSLSGLQRDIEREIALLDELIQKKRDLTIECATFGYYFTKIGTFTIKDGDWSALKNKLQSLVYDGGTQYSVINLAQMNADEYLLFSDGLSTFSEALIKTSKPVHCIVSSPKADYSTLKWISSASKGKFINLNALPQKQVSRLLAEDPLQFLGIKANSQVREVYPSIATPVYEHIALAGIANSGKNTIVLQFGYGNQVTKEETVILDADQFSTTSTDVHRIWAQKKIAEMDIRYEQNKDEIIDLGEFFGIVTRGTSLMVLETLEDYIRYQITPPDELLEAYNQRMKQEQERLKQQTLSLLNAAKNSTQDLYAWWNTVFEKPKPGIYYPKVNKKSDVGENPDVIINVIENDVSVDSDWDFSQDFDAGTETEYSAIVMETVENAPQERFAEESAASANTGRVAGAPQKTKATIYIPEIKQDQSYLSRLTGNEQKDYQKYLEMRPDYISTPTFYFDIASWFYANDYKEKALLILSNIADIDIENAELFKTLAYKLKEYAQYEQEVFICKKVLDWRPMDPQSYRDYGLSLADAGKHQQALKQLYSGLTQNFAQSVTSISRGIEEVLVMEINQLITLHKRSLSVNQIDTGIIRSMPVDIRVVLNWNMLNTDIDLHVTDPAREVCYYSHKRTKIGGRISNDITQGYGPEQFLLKEAMPGKYLIEVNYFGDRQVKSSGPTTVMAEIYLYYADKRQERKVVTLHMTKYTELESNGKVLVGEFHFE